MFGTFILLVLTTSSLCYFPDNNGSREPVLSKSMEVLLLIRSFLMVADLTWLVCFVFTLLFGFSCAWILLVLVLACSWLLGFAMVTLSMKASLGS